MTVSDAYCSEMVLGFGGQNYSRYQLANMCFCKKYRSSKQIKANGTSALSCKDNLVEELGGGVWN